MNNDPTGRDRPHPDNGTGAVPISAPGPAWSRLPWELRQRPQWLLAAPNAVGELKVPRSMNAYGTVLEGSTTDRSTWLTFEDACMWAARNRWGIGYVLSADDPFACVDLDVKDYTTPEQLALFERIAASLDSYAEASQSGRGAHIWIRGKVGPGLKRDGVELYSQERFMVCTGNVWIDRPIQERQEFLTNMVTQMRASVTRRNGRQLATLVEYPARKTDDKVLAKAWNRPNQGLKFRRLWMGQNPSDGSSFWDARGAWVSKDYRSQSEADLALLTLLCLTLESNEQVRRLFRRSWLGQRLDGKLPGKPKPGPARYLDETLAFIRPIPGTQLAYTVRPCDEALPTARVAINVDEGIRAWWDRVEAAVVGILPPCPR